MSLNDPQNRAYYEKKVWDLHIKITGIKDRYNDKLLLLDNQVVNAFITFRSMAAQRRAIFANESKWQKSCLKAFGSKTKDLPYTKFLNRHKLVVKRAMEPELIQWENNGNTSDKKCKRGFIAVLIAIIVLLLSFGGVWTLSIQEK